jgi:hypothetical protein
MSARRRTRRRRRPRCGPCNGGDSRWSYPTPGPPRAPGCSRNPGTSVVKPRCPRILVTPARDYHGRHDLHPARTTAASQHVFEEHTPDQRRPGEPSRSRRPLRARRNSRALVRRRRLLGRLRWHDLGAPGEGGRQDTVVPGQVGAWTGTIARSLSISSWGVNRNAVVSSRQGRLSRDDILLPNC